MPINSLYHIWFGQIQQMYPELCLTQRRNMVWMLSGMSLSRSVQLHRIAGQIPGRAKLTSAVARLMRFLKNPALSVRPMYEPLARQWLAFQAQTSGRMRLVLDGSKVGAGHQLLMVAILFRRRAIPLVWTWMRCAHGHSSVGKQLALLRYVQALLPAGVPVLLVGDTEFESGLLQSQLQQWHWQYVLRQKPNNLVQLEQGADWRHFRDLVSKAGQSIWLPEVLLTARHALPVNLLAHWQRGEGQPWLLATNLPSRQATLRGYRLRMWIEEMFGDLKGHGFDLESTHLRHFTRLSRLTLLVVLLYIWLMTSGVRVIKNGLRYLVDRRDRRDLSVFQIGLRFVERRITNLLTVSIRLVPGRSSQSVR